MSTRWLDPLWAPEWKQGPHTLSRLSNLKLRTLNLYPLSLHKHLSHTWDIIVSHVFRIFMYENYICELIRINIHLFIYLFICVQDSAMLVSMPGALNEETILNVVTTPGPGLRHTPGPIFSYVHSPFKRAKSLLWYCSFKGILSPDFLPLFFHQTASVEPLRGFWCLFWIC